MFRNLMRADRAYSIRNINSKYLGNTRSSGNFFNHSAQPVYDQAHMEDHLRKGPESVAVKNIGYFGGKNSKGSAISKWALIAVAVTVLAAVAGGVFWKFKPVSHHGK